MTLSTNIFRNHDVYFRVNVSTRFRQLQTWFIIICPYQYFEAKFENISKAPRTAQARRFETEAHWGNWAVVMVKISHFHERH